MFDPIDWRKAFSEASTPDFDRLLKLTVGWIRRFTISKYRHKIDHELLAIDTIFALKNRLDRELAGFEPLRHAKVMSLGRTIAKRRVLREIATLNAFKRNGNIQEVPLDHIVSQMHDDQRRNEHSKFECVEIRER